MASLAFESSLRDIFAHSGKYALKNVKLDHKGGMEARGQSVRSGWDEMVGWVRCSEKLGGAERKKG
jgi:hypothetical protein